MRRIVRFITYNLLFALAPIGISWLMRYLNKVTAPDGAYAPDILFLALIISATTLGDITNEARQYSKALLLEVTATFLLLGAVMSAVLYGSYLQDTFTNPTIDAFKTQISLVAAMLAVVLSLVSIIVEIFIARIESAIQAK